MSEWEQQLSAIIEEIVTILTSYGLDVLGAIGILIIGVLVANRLAAGTERALKKSDRVDEMLRGFIKSIVKYLVLAITIVSVLNQFGIQTASLIAVLGAAGLAIGLALQGTLSNVAAGVMLLLFRPFKVGDYVEVAGHAGSVKSLTLFLTELATVDNVQIIIPNGQVWGASMRNFSHHADRRLDLAVGIAYEDDMDQAIAAIKGLIANDARCRKDPEPLVAVANLGDSSVDLVIRIWCDAGDYWDLKWDMTKGIKQTLDAQNISIPYPQRTVHMVAAS